MNSQVNGLHARCHEDGVSNPLAELPTIQGAVEQLHAVLTSLLRRTHPDRNQAFGMGVDVLLNGLVRFSDGDREPRWALQ